MKKYALALWGGAARGIAHIWAIRYFEERHIEITEIAGTSMGAWIGACLAIGMDSWEMEEILWKISFLKLIDLNLFDGLVSGNKVYRELESIFGDRRIEDTKIPLKIVATNMNTGCKEIFTTGKISDAVRASISLPGVFSPFELNDQRYLDGWLHANLPIGELETQDIIGISVVRNEHREIETHKKILEFSIKRGFFPYNYEVFKKTMTIIMTNNEDAQIGLAKMEWKNITLIAPNLENFEYYDFPKYREIIDMGYTETARILAS